MSDAPPSICIDATGKFSGFDNQLLRAIARKLGLQVRFVGTDFSGLLAQVATRRFDVGSASIKATDARRRTVAFTNGYDFGYYSLVVPPGSRSRIHDLAAGQRIGVVQGTVRSPMSSTPCICTGEVSRLHHPLRQPEDPPDRRLGRTGDAGRGNVMQPGDPAVIVANTFSPGNFVAYAVAKDNQPLIDALNSGLDAVIADGTWAQLYSEWVPRDLPPGWKPGRKAAPPRNCRLRRDRRAPTPQGGRARRPEVHAGPAARLLLRLGAVPAGHPRPGHDRACRTR